MRIRITIGAKLLKALARETVVIIPRALLALAALFIFASVACPDLIAQESPKMLPSAQTVTGWRSDLYISRAPLPPGGDVLLPPVTVHAGSSGCTTPDVTIAVGQMVPVSRDYTLTMPLLCRQAFQLVTPPPFVTSYVIVAFDDGAHAFSFRVDPFGAVSIAHPVFIFPVVNDGIDEITLNLFPSQPTTVYYQLGNAAEESCNAKPPVTQCKVSARGAGAINVYLKTPSCNTQPDSPLCAAPLPVYGLITNGRANGAALQAFGF